MVKTGAKGHCSRCKKYKPLKKGTSFCTICHIKPATQDQLSTPDDSENGDDDSENRGERGPLSTTTQGASSSKRPPLQELNREPSVASSDDDETQRHQAKKPKFTRLDNRTPEELAIEVRALRAEKKNLKKELREVKKGVGVGELLKAHADLKQLDSHMLLNLARAINKGVLDPKR
mmetsp:Transcript_30175/g.50778  ORF Transcript_30175/g.50778 Transcript_30175/m.50778 type:complete len:176 (-) Transcript_30175:855-1382(-)